MNDMQSSLNKKLMTYGLSSGMATALGICGAFLSLKFSNFHVFFAVGLSAFLLLTVGGALGIYCWRLLYLTRRATVSWPTYAIGAAAAFIPAVIAFKLLT